MAKILLRSLLLVSLPRLQVFEVESQEEQVEKPERREESTKRKTSMNCFTVRLY